MRFDLHLMRAILLYTEERVEAGCIFNGPFVPSESDEQRSADLNAHAKLLFDDGYFDGHYESNDRGFLFWFAIRDLTMKGHEFLANARNDTVWNELMSNAQAKGLSLSVAVLNTLLEKAVKTKLRPD